MKAEAADREIEGVRYVPELWLAQREMDLEVAEERIRELRADLDFMQEDAEHWQHLHSEVLAELTASEAHVEAVIFDEERARERLTAYEEELAQAMVDTAKYSLSWEPTGETEELMLREKVVLMPTGVLMGEDSNGIEVISPVLNYPEALDHVIDTFAVIYALQGKKS